jgi:hypothetical protein
MRTLRDGIATEAGAGRFIKSGIPAPDLMAPCMGVVEIVCGPLRNWG